MPEKMLTLKHSDKHKWFYYPDMTNDEVIAFKQFYYKKGYSDKVDTPYEACFHCAFTDPRADENAEKRTSTEHRVQVFFK